VSKRRLTGLEVERKRLERLRGKAKLKERRKATESMLPLCLTCGTRHIPVKHIKGATMVGATVTPASSSAIGSEGKLSTVSEKDSPQEKISEESKSTPTDTPEEKSRKMCPNCAKGEHGRCIMNYIDEESGYDGPVCDCGCSEHAS